MRRPTGDEAWGQPRTAVVGTEQAVASAIASRPLEDFIVPDGEDQPAKRSKVKAGQKHFSTPVAASETLMTVSFAFAEGTLVEGLRGGDSWAAARVDNLNEEDNTYDLVFEDGHEEESVPESRLRSR